MPRLKSRERFPPGGFAYYHSETKWSAPANVSFESVVQAIIAHRKANPYLMQQHGWPIDPESVRNQLDDSNARRCAMLGYTDYYYEGPGDPAPNPTVPQPQTNLAGKLAAGAETLVEWLGEGGVPVEKSLAEKRAAVCAACPHNNMEDFSRWFTNPVSQAIRFQIQRKQDMKLETASDEKLGTCAICSCPLKLKAWTPLHNINNNMPADIKAALPAHCWITKQDQI